jgi:hypothetical protein
MSERKRSKVEVVCPVCGERRTIRADSADGLFKDCRGCSARGASQGPRPYRMTGERLSCERCGESFYRRKSEADRRFCSARCRDDARRRYPVETRHCLKCGMPFPYSDKPNSNNSGSYCSLRCRDESYVGTYHGRRSFGYRKHRRGWRTIRNRFVAAGDDYCCGCGKTSGRLMVHHIEPYRVSRNDDFSNLMTFCGKCHSRAERLSDWIEGLPAPCRSTAVILARRTLTQVQRH